MEESPRKRGVIFLVCFSLTPLHSGNGYYECHLPRARSSFIPGLGASLLLGSLLMNILLPHRHQYVTTAELVRIQGK